MLLLLDKFENMKDKCQVIEDKEANITCTNDPLKSKYGPSVAHFPPNNDPNHRNSRDITSKCSDQQSPASIASIPYSPPLELSIP